MTDQNYRELQELQARDTLLLPLSLPLASTRRPSGRLGPPQSRLESRGFCVLAFPCNQFGGQEPGSASEILEFARGK